MLSHGGCSRKKSTHGTANHSSGVKICRELWQCLAAKEHGFKAQKTGAGIFWFWSIVVMEGEFTLPSQNFDLVL